MQILLVIENITQKKVCYTLKNSTQAKLFWHFPFIDFILLQVEKKFHSLHTQFAAELKSEEKKKSGSEGGCYESKWRYMSHMSLLRRGMKRPPGVSTEISKFLNTLILPGYFSIFAYKIFSMFALNFPCRPRVVVAILLRHVVQCSGRIKIIRPGTKRNVPGLIFVVHSTMRSVNSWRLV